MCIMNTDNNLLIDIFYVPVKVRKAHKPRKDKGFTATQIRNLRYEFCNIIHDIGDERDTDDGVWFYLNNGYSLDGCHAVHEWDYFTAKNQLERVETCNCIDCMNP